MLSSTFEATVLRLWGEEGVDVFYQDGTKLEISSEISPPLLSTRNSYLSRPKGRLISRGLFGILNSSKNQGKPIQPEAS